PGPSAFVAALVASGLPTDEFFFGGFLPARSGARRSRLTELSKIPGTLIFYEAPHRLTATLKDASEILGPRKAVVARELTKIREEIRRDTLPNLAKHYSNDEKPKGEIVLLIEQGGDEVASPEGVGDGDIAALVARFENEGFDHRAALKKAARELGLTRSEAYRRLIAERGE